MNMQLVVNTVHLEGNWTIKTVTQNAINSLSCALQEIVPEDSKVLNLDCHRLSAIDTAGRQLLEVWMNCARMRGFEPQLVNLSDDLKHHFTQSTNGLSPV